MKTDDIIGDYKILSFSHRENNQNYYNVECLICGHVKCIGDNNMKRQCMEHTPLNCKEDYYKEYIGAKHGDYTCIGYIKVGHKFSLKIRCDICGNEKTIPTCEWNLTHSAMSCRESYYDYLIGKTFGDFTIIEKQCKSYGDYMYIAKCNKCGTEIRKTGRSLVKNCFKHGTECIKAIDDNVYKQYIVERFYNMYSRCNDEHNDVYKYYGGRGIKLLYEHPVDLYIDFIDEIKKHAAIYGIKNSTFDRIDVNGNYEKENLRIATRKLQNINTTRKRVFILEDANGNRIISDSAMEVGERFGINGRSVGNLVRGKSKSAGGMHLIKILNDKEISNIQEIINTENVTTNLITTL